MIIVVGHKNPDTDSVASAIVFSRILKEEGKQVKPAIAGDLNRETEFIFSRFGIEIPQKITEENLKDKDNRFFLIDHNDLSQSVVNIDSVCGVLDHHPLSGIKTEMAMYFRVEPLGSTATLIYKIMKERGIELKEKEGFILLSAIISDTLNLTSPTTTDEDINCLKELSKITKLEAEGLAQEMFEAKSDFSGKDPKNIIEGDLKEYNFGEKKVGIGVAETTSLSYFEENNDAVAQAVKEVKKENGFDALFFVAVNIISKESYFYPGEEKEKEVIRKVFSGEEKENFFLVEGISSRKKEIAPPLSAYYEKV